MPHIITNQFNPPKFPIEIKGIIYHFFAQNINYSDDFLCKVTIEDKNFYLQIKQKDNNRYMIKAEKYTRISPKILLHKAIYYISEYLNTPILFSNLSLKENPHIQENDYLKDINYFINNHKFDKEHHIEVGFGSGRHLLYQAKQNPNIQFIGLEIHKPSIEQVQKQIKIQNLDNLLIIDYDARLFLEFVPSNIVGKIYVHFPVPWDKKPHRRVIKISFVQEALRVLKVNGALEVRTDSENYFTSTVDTFLKLNQTSIKINKNLNNAISSKYEDRWVKQQKNIYDIILTSLINSDNIEVYNDFSFPKKKIDIESLKIKLKEKQIYEDSFINIDKIYQVDDNHFIISISMGSFEQNEHLYIESKDTKTDYFPTLPIPSKINTKLHQNLKGLLYG